MLLVRRSVMDAKRSVALANRRPMHTHVCARRLRVVAIAVSMVGHRHAIDRWGLGSRVPDCNEKVSCRSNVYRGWCGTSDFVWVMQCGKRQLLAIFTGAAFY